MELVALHKRVIGLDVHQAQIMACAIIEESDGTMRIEQRQFGAFKRDRRALVKWAASLAPDKVVMESTGIYWKSPYTALEAAGIRAQVVNAEHVKNVPGRKTDGGICLGVVVSDLHGQSARTMVKVLLRPPIPALHAFHRLTAVYQDRTDNPPLHRKSRQARHLQSLSRKSSSILRRYSPVNRV